MIFLVFMLLYTLFREKTEVSFYENRKLAQFPDIKISELINGNFSVKLIDFFSDQIAGRNKFMKIYADIASENS